MLKSTIRYEYPSIPAGKPFTLRMIIGVIGESKPERPRPLNLALALDKSGSMHGQKLARALDAAGMIAGLMGSGETFSLVTFDSQVHTVLPPAKGADLKGIDAILACISAGSNTNLGCGYLEAARNAAHAATGSMSRVILLSDGRANEGMTDTVRLAALAGDTRRRGITTSTYGIGDDFDEELMTAMAESGGGAAYYIDQPADAVEVFREEMDVLRNLVGSGCRVTFTPDRKAVTGFRQLNSYPREGDGTFLLGDISAVEERTMVLSVDLTAQKRAGGILEAGHFLISWLDASGAERKAVLPLVTGVVTPEEFALQPRNTEVAVEAAMLAVSAAKREARKLGRHRRFEDAAALLERLIASIESEGLEDRQLTEELGELRERANRLRTERERYMDARQSKMMMYEAEHSSKGRRSSYMSQKERLFRTHMAQTGGSREIIVGLDLPWLNCSNAPVAGFDNMTVTQFLRALSDSAGDDALAGEYGRSWYLREEGTARVMDIGRPWAKANGRRHDSRPADVAGITPGTMLQATALPRLRRQNRPPVPVDTVQLDVSLLLPQVVDGVSMAYVPGMPTCEFLARVFQLISSVVMPNSYGRSWLLRDTAGGRVFDVGTPWALTMACARDERPLSVTGIGGGAVLQVLPLR